MKIKVLKAFAKVEGLTDQEKVFCWFASKLLDKYGVDTHLTMDGTDFKILAKGTTETHLTSAAYSPAFSEAFKFAWYSDRRVGFEMHKNLRKIAVMRFGRLIMGYEEVEIESTTAILTYSYMLATLAHMENWTYESDSIIGFTEEDLIDEFHAQRANRKTNSFELTQLLKVARLDHTELL